MENFTGNGWFILGLTLVIGWLLGLLSRSGGGKWKAAYNREREAHVALRKEFDAHLKQHAMVAPVGTVDRQPLRTGAF
jgi:hypothetical protein